LACVEGGYKLEIVKIGAATKTFERLLYSWTLDAHAIGYIDDPGELL
jgi:hypothetical protein